MRSRRMMSARRALLAVAVAVVPLGVVASSDARLPAVSIPAGCTAADAPSQSGICHYLSGTGEAQVVAADVLGAWIVFTDQGFVCSAGQTVAVETTTCFAGSGHKIYAVVYGGPGVVTVRDIRT